MRGRTPHYGRRPRNRLKAGVGIATAVVVGGGAIGLTVAATSSHSPSTVSSTGYTTSVSPAALANEALVSSSSSTTNKLLAKLGSVKSFAEFQVHGKVVAIQRGTVVLATKKFVILKSKNGTLKLWWLSGGTKFADVAASPSGRAALTAGTAAAAMANNAPKVVTVTDAATGTTVKVVIVKTTAVVFTKTAKTTSKIVENAFTSVRSLKRGDPALILGLHANGALHAANVLFEPVAK